MSELDNAVIRHALKTAREFGFRSVRLKSQGATFRGVLGDHDVDAASATIGDEERPLSPKGPIDVESSAVGYYREVGEPLRVGRRVTAGEVLAIVSALGLENDVLAPVAGEIVEVLVRADQPLEYGQVIARLLPSGESSR